jgi:hypothetical protein
MLHLCDLAGADLNIFRDKTMPDELSTRTCPLALRSCRSRYAWTAWWSTVERLAITKSGPADYVRSEFTDIHGGEGALQTDTLRTSARRIAEAEDKANIALKVHGDATVATASSRQASAASGSFAIDDQRPGSWCARPPHHRRIDLTMNADEDRPRQSTWHMIGAETTNRMAPARHGNSFPA